MSGTTETINIHGIRTLAVTTGGSFDPIDPSVVTVNLAAHSQWIGTFAEKGNATLVVRGSGAFNNNGTSVANGNTFIGVNVTGAGTIREFQSHSVPGKLEFLHGVSAGQTVISNGYEQYGGEFGVVQIDDPHAYHAANVLGFGEIIMRGLAATSYSLAGDLLSLFQGNVPTYQTRLAFTSPPIGLNDLGNGNPAPRDFGVSQTAGSVIIHADGSQYAHGGTLLAAHG